jgi:SusD family
VWLHERSVELAFEEHRFGDVRQWKIAFQTEKQKNYYSV